MSITHYVYLGPYIECESDTLTRLTVTIEPYLHAMNVKKGDSLGDAELVELHVRIQRWPGDEVSTIELVPRDHFRSLFDRVWERAKMAIDEELKRGHKEENRDAHQLQRHQEQNSRGTTVVRFKRRATIR